MDKRNKQTAYKQAYNERAYARLAITIPKARKAAVDEYARSKGESINGLINNFLRESLCMSEEEWKCSDIDNQDA